MTTMNKSITTILALLALCAAPAMAVPAGINYQGALTDDQGNPITGTRMMSIKLYTAATDGTLLYSEDIGEVDVSDGVFSFEFGAGGTSNAQQTDTVAITDGTATTFQKVLSAAEVVAGSVSVTDGTYTWSQSGGSSNEDAFGVAYSTSLRRVSVTYFNGAPAAGRTITATYRTPASGIAGALAGDNQPWAEIAVDGVAQIPRQKVLAVPFAINSSTANRATTTAGVKRTRFLLVDRLIRERSNVALSDFVSLPFEYSPPGGKSLLLNRDSLPGLRSFPLGVPLPSRLKGISASVIDSSGFGTSSPYNGSRNMCFGNIVVRLYIKRAGQPDETIAYLDSGGEAKPGATVISQDLDIILEGEEVLWAEVWSSYEGNLFPGSSTVDGQLRVNWVKLEFEQTDLE
jgi:hypothetical protein